MTTDALPVGISDGAIVLTTSAAPTSEELAEKVATLAPWQSFLSLFFDCQEKEMEALSSAQVHSILAILSPSQRVTLLSVLEKAEKDHQRSTERLAAWRALADAKNVDFDASSRHSSGLPLLDGTPFSLHSDEMRWDTRSYPPRIIFVAPRLTDAKSGPT